MFDTYLVSCDGLLEEIRHQILLDSQTCLDLAGRCDVSILSADISQWNRTAKHGDFMRLYYGTQLMKIDVKQLKRQTAEIKELKAQLEVAMAGLRKIADFQGACGYFASRYEEGFDEALKHCHKFANDALSNLPIPQVPPVGATELV